MYTDYINNFETTKELISIFKSHTVLTQAILDCEFELREQNVKLEDLIFAPAQQIKQYYHMLQVRINIIILISVLNPFF